MELQEQPTTQSSWGWIEETSEMPESSSMAVELSGGEFSRPALAPTHEDEV